jgi:AcrR family transcriptional regulator
MTDQRLPRGPHTLSREEVADSQRTRLLRAMVELVAERGFAAVTIADLASRAAVSRGAFYEQFADKEECLLAAYDAWALTALEAMTLDLPEDGDWESFVERSLHGYLGAIQSDRAAASAFLVHMEAAGDAARARRREMMHGFAAVLADRHDGLRALDPSLGPMPDQMLLGFVLGVREIVREEIEERPDRDLTDLVPVFQRWLTAMVRGA